MARVRMVTRTINVIEVEALCVDVTTAQPQYKSLELTGLTDTTPSYILKLVQKQYNTDEFKVVATTNITTREELYGLTELDFLKYATRLDPETRKALETE